MAFVYKQNNFNTEYRPTSFKIIELFIIIDKYRYYKLKLSLKARVIITTYNLIVSSCLIISIQL